MNQAEHVQSFWNIVWTEFKSHKMAVLGSILITFFIVIALSAELIEWTTGLDPNAQNVTQRYLPPFTRSEKSMDQKESALEYFISKNPETASTLQTKLIENNLVTVTEPEDAIYDLINFPSSEALVKLNSLELDLPGLNQLKQIFNNFTHYHLIGTDELGRDVFIRLIYGTRVSIGVGVLVALSSALIGLIIGSIAGFYGGLWDTLLMRLTDSLLSLPTIPILIIMAAIDLSKLPALKALINPSYESIYKMVIILCFFSWMQVALLIRGSILTLREREFILAAKTLGAKDRTIIVRHMFPNVIAPVLVSISLGVGESILFESALSFLGLGIMPPTPSWGNMLNNAQQLIYDAPLLAVIPGLLIMVTTVSFNFVGDGLQQAIDPKSVKR